MKHVIFLFCILAAIQVVAHPGGLDANGGHTDRQTGLYHYHRGTNSLSAGTSVESRSLQVTTTVVATPMKNQSPATGSTNESGEPKPVESELDTAKSHESHPKAWSVSELAKLPWWVYLIGLGCGYVIWEVSCYYCQKKKSKG